MNECWFFQYFISIDMTHQRLIKVSEKSNLTSFYKIFLTSVK